MAYRLGAFSDVGLDEALLKLVIGEHTNAVKPRLDRLWTYYRNPLQPVGHWALSGLHGAIEGLASRSRTGNWYRLAQEIGLPPRVTGLPTGDAIIDDRAGSRREVVIENDIAWRIHAMIDFLFAKPVKIRSLATDAAQRERIETALSSVWEGSGGIALLQDAALLGHVHGHVDLLVRLLNTAGTNIDLADEAAMAQLVRIETIEPRRGIAIMDAGDYRAIAAYIIHFGRELNSVQGDAQHRRRASDEVTEIFSATHTQRYEADRLTRSDALEWTQGRVPVVHIQNVSQPFAYEGLSEVEPLIPLQDELNTRLSDRASRVTIQSFRMYLAKGLDLTQQVAVGPGQMWITENDSASITTFGGDGTAPGEDQHIAEIRSALDKISGVPPLASGVVQAKVGNLSSANALRVTLMGVLSKTERKRVTYGRGILEVSRLVLAALDHAGVLKTRVEDRALKIEWPEVLPADSRDTLAAAEARQRLGVPQSRVLEELGYEPEEIDRA